MTGFAGDPQPLPVEPSEAPPERARIRGRALVGAVLCLAAAGLAVVGSFADLYSVDYGYSEQRLNFATTSWTTRTSSPEFGAEALAVRTPPNWGPLMVAATVLLAAAALGAYGVRRESTGRIARASGPVAAVGAAFLAATVSTIGMQELGWLGEARNVRESAPDDVEVLVEAAVGDGFWMLVAAAGLGIVAALFAWRPVRNTDREEPETPRIGIPVVHRLPDA